MRRWLVAALVVAVVVPVLASGSATGPAGTFTPYVNSQTLQAWGLFRVAVDGSTAVVADWNWETGPGRVTVYGWDGAAWVKEQLLLSPDPPPVSGGDRFGSALDLQGDVIVVGQWNPLAGAGSVHVFEHRHGKWRHTERIGAATGQAAVVWGDTIAVSGDPPVAYHRAVGTVRLYERDPSGWNHTRTLRRGQDGHVGCRYGFALDIWQDRLVVGDLYSHDPCEAYVAVYERDGGAWSRMQRLRGRYRGFGLETSVAIWGDTLAVGDPSPPAVFGDATVHLFEWDGTRWRRSQEVRRPTEFFGTAVALHQDHLVVGDSHREQAWVFTRIDGTWRFAQTLGSSGSGTGRYVDIHGAHVLSSQDRLAHADYLRRCEGLIPTLVGTDWVEHLTGTAAPDVIMGGPGDDTIDLLAGNDVACAGSGSDLVRGGAGSDRILGDGGDDLLLGQVGPDLLIGGPGIDEGRGGGGVDTCLTEVMVDC